VNPGRGKDGQWSDPHNWSANRLPGQSDRACLGPGTVVTLVGAKVQLASINDEGTLYLIGKGELALGDLSRTSRIEGLVLSSGVLSGDATLAVHRLNWQEDGRMEGAGETLIPRGSSGSFAAGDGGRGLLGPRRELRISGQFAVSSGALYVDPTANIKVLGGHVIVNPFSAAHNPQGLLQRRNGLPLPISRRTGMRVQRGFRTGTPGAHPLSYDARR
jgi:hypothetical protein